MVDRGRCPGRDHDLRVELLHGCTVRQQVKSIGVVLGVKRYHALVSYQEHFVAERRHILEDVHVAFQFMIWVFEAKGVDQVLVHSNTESVLGFIEGTNLESRVGECKHD